jgi:site-specific DNA-methyltransferase (adenine-specific)
MKPIELWQGDCLELMKNIPDGSVDLVLTDPPYGTTACKWDSVIPFEPMWEQLNRIIKPNGAIVLFSQQPFTTALISSNYKMFRYDWIWDKLQGTGHLNAKKMPMKSHENILVFYRKLPTYNPQLGEGAPYVSTNGSSEKGTSSKNYGEQKYSVKTINDGKRYPKSVLRFGKNRAEKRIHATQKPVALLEYLVRTYTNEGETVLDFTMGSGSTGVACVNTDRHFIGIELDEGYFNIAKKRIEEAYAD